MKKYVIHQGIIRSKNDGDIHFISADKLMHLYGVSPKECLIDVSVEQRPDLIHLFPRYHGDYTLPTNSKKDEPK